MTDIPRERVALAGQGLVIIERSAWGAVQSYTSDRTVNEPASWFFLHISVTTDPDDTLAAEAFACRVVEAIGQERFGIGCSYNAGVMQSGRLYEMQPLTRRGAHTVNDRNIPGFPQGSLNYDGRACVLVQNVQDTVTTPQIDAAARWAAAQVRSGLAKRNASWYGHRDFALKACPGDKGYARLPELRDLTEHYIINGLVPTSPPEDDDMPIPVYGVQNDATAYYMAPRDGYVQIFHPWDPEIDEVDPRVVWLPTETFDACKGKTYKNVEYVTRPQYDAIAKAAKTSPTVPLVSVFGVEGDPTAYYMAPRDGYVLIFHQFNPGLDDPQVVWQPTEVWERCRGEVYTDVKWVDRATYDAIAAVAKSTIYPPVAG